VRVDCFDCSLIVAYSSEQLIKPTESQGKSKTLSPRAFQDNPHFPKMFDVQHWRIDEDINQYVGYWFI
jgi:hypothetical protein